MGTRLRSWWQNIRKHRLVAIIITLVIAATVLILVESLINGTGFNGYYTTSTTVIISGTPPAITRTETYQPGKMLWDWMQLLIIPIVLAIGGFWFNQIQKDREQKATEQRAKREEKAIEQRVKTEHEIARDNQREVALQDYINKMSELLLDNDLCRSEPSDEVRRIARVRTLTVLNRLDTERKRDVLQFLYESGLINKDKCIIALEGADLSKTNFSHTNLRGADLSGAILRGVTLGGANLSEVNLSKTDLWGADFNGVLGRIEDLSTIGGPQILVFDSYDGGIAANLRGADLSETILYGSNATVEQLAQAKSLRGATLPGGSKHP